MICALFLSVCYLSVKFTSKEKNTTWRSHFTSTILATGGWRTWAAAVRSTSVWRLKGKAPLLWGCYCQNILKMITSRKSCPGLPRGWRRRVPDGRGTPSIDDDPIVSWSPICRLRAATSTLLAPLSILRRETITLKRWMPPPNPPSLQ